jgi:hypothetical protein
MVAVRAGGDDGQRAAGQFFQGTQVGAGGRGQLVPFGDAVGGFGPAEKLQVNRLAFFPALGIARGVPGFLVHCGTRRIR